MNDKKDYTSYLIIILVILILVVAGIIFFQNNNSDNNGNNGNNGNGNDNEPKTIELSGISFDDASKTLKVNEQIQLTLNYYPSNATNKSVTWTSSNNNIVNVSSSGLITAKNSGDATITVTSYNNKTAFINIKVIPNTIPVQSITITNGDSKVDIGKTLQLKVTISPTDATNKSITWKSSDTSIATVDNNGLVKGIKEGNVNITATSNNDKTSTIKLTVNKVEVLNYADIFFLNVYNKPKILESLKTSEKYKNGYDNGESFIIKTYDQKYILIDTGHKNTEVTNVIYNALKKLQGTDNVTIDYMILTHSHGDHTGNAVSIISNKKIKVNNVIIKNESKAPGVYKNVKTAIKNEGNLVNLTNDGQTISLGKYLDIMLFNTSDVYKDKTCHSGYRITYNAAKAKATKINGLYYYFDGSDYPNTKLKSTKEIKLKHESIVKGLDNYFYASLSTSKSSDCNPNSNSLAIIIKVKTNSGNRYMYLPGDLDNGGYDIFAMNGYYGNSATRIYNSRDNVKYSTKTNSFTGVVSGYNKIPSETNAANSIKKTLGNDIKNITIYQATHHGINNAPDAINILGINNSKVNAIIPVKGNSANSTSFMQVRTYYYTLSKTKRFYPGGKTKGGVHCKINNLGTTTCANY